MKVLAYILTAAAVLIGADVFVMSSDSSALDAPAVSEEQVTSLHGGNGMPPPPPD